MTTFITHDSISKSDLLSLNRVRYFYGFIILSDITSICDKYIISDFKTNYFPNKHLWHKEKPTNRDYKIWNSAWKSISSTTYTWSIPLGKWKSLDHLPFRWLWNSNTNQIFKNDKSQWTTFTFDPSEDIYTIQSSSDNISEYSHYCEVTIITQSTLKLRKHINSSQIVSIPNNVKNTSMTKNNNWILKHCTFYKESDQITQLFTTGRARVVTDGSFF